MPLGTSLTAEKLEPYSQRLIRGLINSKIQVVSYACDGTEIERKIQALLVTNGDSRIEYAIAPPKSSGDVLKCVVPIFDSQPVAMIQDSKHALKTFRNNLYSGARLLVLGNHSLFYAQIHKLAHDPGTPLYRRDVEKLDRQDDNAATRLFSADTLQFLGNQNPEWVGLAVYLFIFGELVDAYQSRRINHAERLAMVLRAWYFLNLWDTFLDTAGYKKEYLLSRECLDITRILIEGYVSLLVIYRDHMSEQVPLIPHLHSSETCEHCIGESRKIVKDFCYADFLYMIPKLHVAVRQANLRARAANGKARASGYCHTYFDNSGLDPLLLAVFPDDDQIHTRIVPVAFDEADQLFVALGIQPSRLRSLHSLRQRGTVQLPSISFWYKERQLDEEMGFDEDDSSIFDPLSEADELQQLLQRSESDEVQSAGTQKQLEIIQSLNYAAAALHVDEHMKVQAFADQVEDNDEVDEECLELHHYWTANVTAPPLHPVVTMPSIFGRQGIPVTASSFDYSILVDLRRAHQTYQAEHGVRTTQSVQVPNKDSAHMKIIKAMRDILKETQERGLTTGLGRSFRTKALGSKADVPIQMGNSANAAAVASSDANAVRSFHLYLEQNN
ncbi:hypothetical protein C8R41DRAFT_964684 [Lentinula lateritia]|uniref:Uncharacterized protein n=1 Tax=Lentinula lateritia TaxID=40482 RepID=A0ABQ8V691_9AGAR|nr:hypothetical protein C8R41DRAFT_964684 [Lentinula lateritia]